VKYVDNENGCDCGVFVLFATMCASAGLDLTFRSRHGDASTVDYEGDGGLGDSPEWGERMFAEYAQNAYEQLEGHFAVTQRLSVYFSTLPDQMRRTCDLQVFTFLRIFQRVNHNLI
jgi:hypothetical protein